MLHHTVAQAEAASANNFDGFFAGQHYLIGPEKALIQSISLLSYLAGRFPGMYVATSVFLLPLAHPVMVAEQTAALDVLSGGKFLFGVGQGYRDKEFDSFSIDKRTRSGRMIEGLELIRRLWAEEKVTFHGEFFHVEDAGISPKPLQRPGPPVLIGADTLESISRVPSIGDYWLVSPRHSKSFLRKAVPRYREALEKEGKPFKGLPMGRELCVSKNRAEAEERIKIAFEETYRQYRRWGQPGERYYQDFEALKKERLIIGTPDEVAEQVVAYQEEFGVDFMLFRAYWPGADPAWALETLELFGQKVIPQVKGRTQASALP